MPNMTLMDVSDGMMMTDSELMFGQIHFTDTKIATIEIMNYDSNVVTFFFKHIKRSNLSNIRGRKFRIRAV